MNSLKKVYHIADIHCRLYDRHDEYRYIFNKLFEKIKELGTEDAIICIAGDVAHVKADVSSEYFVLATELIRGCAELCSTIIIPGNHDFMETNKNRIDAITPIINALSSDRVVYMRDSGVIQVGDTAFSHYSIYDDSSKWIHANEITGSISRKICMFHGAVEGAVTSIGFSAFSHAIPISEFDGYDIVLLGDIHKYSTFGNGNIAYASSLIQQDRGESFDYHGLIEWNVQDGTHIFHNLYNPYGVYTIYANDSTDVTGIDLKSIPEARKIIIVYSGSSATNQSLICDYIKSAFPSCKVELDAPKIKIDIATATDTQVMSAMSDVDTDSHMSLFNDYFSNSGIEVSDEDMEYIASLHRDFYTSLHKNAGKNNPNGSMWTPISFEWDNMFSYGEGNKISFESWEGIIGLFAPNQSGKSNFIDSILFTIFDQCTRTSLAGHVLNRTADSFSGKFVYREGDYIYTIIRIGVKEKKGNVSVKVVFQRENADGVEVLTRDKRDTTNAEIRKYIGTYEDFIFTTLSSVADSRTFIDMKQAERKNTLYRYLQLDKFGMSYDAADKSYKLKKNESLAFGDVSVIRSDIGLAQTTIDSDVSDIELHNQKRYDILGLLQECEREINTISSELSSIESFENLQELESKIESVSHNIKLFTERKEQAMLTLSQNKDKLATIPVMQTDVLNKRRGEISLILNKYRDLEKDLAVANAILSKHEQNAELLSKHEYDPNCKYCVSNPFVVSARESISCIDAARTDRDRILLEMESMNISLIRDEDMHIANELTRAVAVNNEKSSLEMQSVRYENDISNMNDKISELTKSLYDYEERLNKHKNDSESIKKLERLKSVLIQQNERHKELKDGLWRTEMAIEVATKRIYDNKTRIELLASRLEKAESIIKECTLYSHYLSAVHRDGIPLMVLKKIIPIVEAEVNNYIRDVVDFRISLEFKEDSIIGYIISSNNDMYPFELASGMEKFMITSCIRAAFLRISHMNRPDFIFIDEGFGVLDKNNIHKVSEFLRNLATEFKFILCITHINELKDATYTMLTVSKVDGISRIMNV